MASRRRGSAAAAIAGLAVIALSTAACAPGQCSGAYVADIETSHEGSSTVEEAIEVWVDEGNRPVGSDAWEVVSQGSGSAQATHAGGWRVGLMQTRSGGWIVSGLSCD